MGKNFHSNSKRRIKQIKLSDHWLHNVRHDVRPLAEDESQVSKGRLIDLVVTQRLDRQLVQQSLHIFWTRENVVLSGDEDHVGTDNAFQVIDRSSYVPVVFEVSNWIKADLLGIVIENDLDVLS